MDDSETTTPPTEPDDEGRTPAGEGVDETSTPESKAERRIRQHPVASAIGADEAVAPDLTEDEDEDQPRFRDTWDAEEMGNAP